MKINCFGSLTAIIRYEIRHCSDYRRAQIMDTDVRFLSDIFCIEGEGITKIRTGYKVPNERYYQDFTFSDGTPARYYPRQGHRA